LGWPIQWNTLVLFKFIAEVAHLVEHNLAKVGVAGSSPVFRSVIPDKSGIFFGLTIQNSNLETCLLQGSPSDRQARFEFRNCPTIGPGGGTGRHAGLKILWPAMAVTVQLRSGAQSDESRFFYFGLIKG
jgi:hypothetical protein